MTVDVTHFLFAIRSAPIRLPMLCSSVAAARRSDIERRRPSLRQRIDQSVAAEPVAGGFSRNGVGKTEAKVELLHFVTTAAAANLDPAFAVSPLELARRQRKLDPVREVPLIVALGTSPCVASSFASPPSKASPSRYPRFEDRVAARFSPVDEAGFAISLRISPHAPNCRACVKTSSSKRATGSADHELDCSVRH